MQKIELRYWLEYDDEKKRNKLVERKALVDTGGLRVPIWKIIFVLVFCGFPNCGLRFVVWIGRFPPFTAL